MTTALVKKTASGGRTVRQRIMDALENTLRTMQEDGQNVWRSVVYGDPEEVGNDLTPFVAIDCGTEEKISSAGGCTIYHLPVFLHMRWPHRRGMDAHDYNLYYLGLLQKAVLANHNLGGLTYNVEEDSSTFNIVGIDDAYPGGTLSIVLMYKTRFHDPYKSPHDPT